MSTERKTRNNTVLLVIVILLAALVFPVLLKAIGALTGLLLGGVIAAGVLLFVLFLVLLILAGTGGILVPGILGLFGVVLLAVALPFLAPLFLVILPLAILLKIIIGK